MKYLILFIFFLPLFSQAETKCSLVLNEGADGLKNVFLEALSPSKVGTDKYLGAYKSGKQVELLRAFSESKGRQIRKYINKEQTGITEAAKKIAAREYELLPAHIENVLSKIESTIRLKETNTRSIEEKRKLVLEKLEKVNVKISLVESQIESLKLKDPSLVELARFAQKFSGIRGLPSGARVNEYLVWGKFHEKLGQTRSSRLKRLLKKSPEKEEVYLDVIRNIVSHIAEKAQLKNEIEELKIVIGKLEKKNEKYDQIINQTRAYSELWIALKETEFDGNLISSFSTAINKYLRKVNSSRAEAYLLLSSIFPKNSKDFGNIILAEMKIFNPQALESVYRVSEQPLTIRIQNELEGLEREIFKMERTMEELENKSSNQYRVDMIKADRLKLEELKAEEARIQTKVKKAIVKAGEIVEANALGISSAIAVGLLFKTVFF